MCYKIFGYQWQFNVYIKKPNITVLEISDVQYFETEI